jgi:two-component system nitrogen regulation sensor histidine kinase NtrY
MGYRSRFVAGLAWRAAALLGTVLLFTYALETPGLGAARILAGLLCLWALYELWRHIGRTNVELARFVEAVRLGDLSQSFSHGAEGSGFGEIGRALDGAIRALREERHRLSDAGRFYERRHPCSPSAMTAASSSPTRRHGACSSAIKACGSRIFATMARPSLRCWARRRSGGPGSCR